VPSSLTPEQRTIRARIAAFSLHAQGGTNTSAATAGQMARFEAQVDPDGILPSEERAQRAAFARKAHMAGLALRASRARSKRSRGTPPDDQR
jgi:hypothetical protein